MKDFAVNTFNWLFHSSNARSLLLRRNILFNSVLQILSVILSLLLLPVSLKFVTTEQYGIWLTISSVLLWFSRFDLGLGSGLKNKIGEELALGNKLKVKQYISTAYIAITVIMTLVSGIFYLIHDNVNWIELLKLQNLNDIDRSLVLNTINVVFYFFLMRFVLQIINSIFEAFQLLYLARFSNFISQLLILLTILILARFNSGNIYILGIIFSLSPIVIFLIFTSWFFLSKAKNYRPSVFHLNTELLRPMFSLSLKFFLIQVNMLVLFQTSNILILRLYGSEDVVKYNIAFNLFSVINLAFSTIAAPYWAAYINAYTLKDYEWIRKSILQLKKIWFAISVGALFMLLLSDWIYYIWIGKDMQIPFSLSLAVYLYNVLFSFGLIYNTFINGTGKVMLQTISLTILSVIFIPLVLFLSKIIGLQIEAIPISLLIVSIYTVIVAPYQYNRIITLRAVGILNK